MGSFTSSLSNAGSPASPSIGNNLVPSVEETRLVAAMLVRRGNLPVEVAIEILDLADYFPTMSCSSNRPLNVQAGWSGNVQSIPILQTLAIPSIPDLSDDCIRRIIVMTDSHDQGFSSFPQHQGTREASSSWFELAIVRPPASMPSTSSSAASTDQSSAPMPGSLPSATSQSTSSPTSAPPTTVRPLQSVPILETVQRIRLYSNLHAHREFTPFGRILEKQTSFNRQPSDDTLTFDADAEGVKERSRREAQERERDEERFMNCVKPGDRLVLYAMAQYPAWSNIVRHCRIDVEMKAL